MSYQEKLQALRKARGDRDKAQDGLYSLRVQQLKLLREQKKFERQETGTGSVDPGGALQNLSAQLPVARGDLLAREQDVAGLLDTLFLDVTPEQLIEEWSDTKPIVLFPLRIETKFREGHLCVRVFPDEISVATHEKVLTERPRTGARPHRPPAPSCSSR
jgi:hypothetical protein